MHNMLDTKTTTTPDAKTLRSDFLRDGFVRLPGFLPLDEIADLNVRMDRIIQEIVPTLPPEVAFYEEENVPATLKQIQHLYRHDRHIEELYRGPFLELARTLLDDEATPQNMQWFNKPAQIGKPTPPHQDGYYFKLDPCEALTMWLALEQVDEVNGCVRYLVGSHKKGMRLHSVTQTRGFSQGISDYGDDDFANERAFPAQPGDLLVHHAMTVHRADANTSIIRTRRALGFIYYAKSAKKNEAAHEEYVRQLKNQFSASKAD